MNHGKRNYKSEMIYELHGNEIRSDQHGRINSELMTE